MFYFNIFKTSVKWKNERVAKPRSAFTTKHLRYLRQYKNMILKTTLTILTTLPRRLSICKALNVATLSYERCTWDMSPSFLLNAVSGRGFGNRTRPYLSLTEWHCYKSCIALKRRPNSVVLFCTSYASTVAYLDRFIEKANSIHSSVIY